MGDILYIVVPCYKEEEVLPETAKRLKEKMDNLISEGKIAENSRIVFVNDGSTDSTWEIIKELHINDKVFSGINLSRNRGHQNALLAGLMTVIEYADVSISMDADLQDDIGAVDRMLDKYYEGFDIVYGVRSRRDTDTFFKKFSAEGFYKLMELLGAKIVFNHADYRLMSKRALQGLGEFREVNLFLRGIIPMIGYKSTTVEYERGERFAGESKYPLKKMITFAFEGITSLSIAPIRFIGTIGAILMLIGIIMLIAGVGLILSSVWFIGGIQLIAIRVIGEYLGKIYLETKARPRFIVDEFINEN
ncbi:MAG: glycosyltransferase family 2 protein [Defluviitaleaceae bacterium]|nr:glycosyltransferase family 2 protein [Defluviitaleaceae bacterium]